MSKFNGWQLPGLHAAYGGTATRNPVSFAQFQRLMRAPGMTNAI